MNFLRKRKNGKKTKFVYDSEKGVLVNKNAKGEKLPPEAVLCCASPLVITKEKIQMQNLNLRKD